MARKPDIKTRHRHERSAAMAPPNRTTDLGRVSGSLCEALAWLTSPAAIAGEISALEKAQATGDTTEATRVLLRDWRAVQRAQATLVQLEDESEAA